MRRWVLAVAAITPLLLSCVTDLEQEAPAEGTGRASEEARTVRQGVQGTQFLNPDAFLGGYADPDWYKNNIPFFEAPDREIQDVYYYRWYAFRQHIRYATPSTRRAGSESRSTSTITRRSGFAVAEA